MRGVSARRPGAALAVAFLLAGFSGSGGALLHDQGGRAAQVSNPAAQALLGGATRYALSHVATLVRGGVVQANGHLLPPGGSPGQSQSPTPAQLHAMGYLSDDTAVGDVRVDVVPPACTAAPCALEVSATVAGVTLKERIALGQVRTNF